MLLLLSIAAATVCSDILPGAELLTPEVVPSNASIAIGHQSLRTPYAKLTYDDGSTVRHTVHELEGQVVLEPFEPLEPGSYFVRVDDETLPLTVTDEVDTTAPPPPDLDTVDDRVAGDTWEQSEPRFVIRLHSLPDDSHTEIRLEPEDGAPLTVFSADRTIELGFNNCSGTYPLDYQGGQAYAFRMRTVDAAGNTSAWLSAPVWPAEPEPGSARADAEGCGCQAGAVPSWWRWLSRR